MRVETAKVTVINDEIEMIELGLLKIQRLRQNLGGFAPLREINSKQLMTITFFSV
jgi:hypothetical protein